MTLLLHPARLLRSWTAFVLLFAGFAVPAQAQYQEQTGSDNPLDAVIVTSTNAAVDALVGDFDTDGDLDVLAYEFVSSASSTLRYYRNDGGAFTEVTSTHPFSGVTDVFQTRGTAFVLDVDGDGDMDVVSYEGGSEPLVLVENTDGSTYAKQTGASNPFAGVSVTGNSASVDAIMGDFGGTEAPDLLVFDGAAEVYYENDGAGTFTQQTGADNPFDGIAQSFWTKANTLVADLDGDGDDDVYYDNGSASQYLENDDGSDSFTIQSDSASPLDGVQADADFGSLAMVAGDYDGDGVLNLLTITSGAQRLYDLDGTGSYADVTASSSLFDSADPAMGVKATTFAADLDADGDVDLSFPDEGSNGLRFVENTEPPAFAITDGSASGLDVTADAAPGTANNVVGAFALSTDAQNVTMDGVTLTNDAPGVTGIAAARLYGSDDLVLDVGSDDELAALPIDNTSAPATLAFGGFSDPVGAAPRYLILAIDVEAGASASGIRFFLDQPSDLTVAGATLGTVNGASATGFAALPLSANTTALPVEMTAFDATAVDEGVHLRWETATETNNAGFEIQRRTTTGGGWAAVRMIAGGGTTDAPRTYRFTDTRVPFTADVVRYRLRQVDVDGTARLTSEVQVDRRGVDRLALLAPYPNPVRTHATVRVAIPEGTEDARLVLYDLLGRTVRTLALTGAGRQEHRLSTQGLAAGLYFLRLTGGGRAQTQRVAVVR